MHTRNSFSFGRFRILNSILLGLTLSLASTFSIAKNVLFDDFSYNSTAELAANGWTLRTWQGGPGLSNGSWSANNFSFVTDDDGNRSLRLKASTNINGNNIINGQSVSGSNSQAEIARAEEVYKNGTWATRMYFNDAPTTGPDGDTVIETFFGLTKYIEGAEPYSEVDFEYLPNGGWWSGSETPAMWSGTYRIVDWSDPSNHGVTRTPGSLQGWHTLVINVVDGHIAFYIDGNFQTSFSGDVAPDYPMYLMFQIWFSNDCLDSACNRKGYLNNSSYREYFEDIDWVYFEKDTQMTTDEVVQTVECYRNSGTSFVQTVTGGSSECTTGDNGGDKGGDNGGDNGGDIGGDNGGDNNTDEKVCNWWGTRYAICTHIDSGWGWQNNADCVGILTCETLQPPYGVEGGDSSEAFNVFIEAESYSNMSGVQLEATTDVDGLQNVGWIDIGDWMAYESIDFPISGTYKVEYRVASINGARLSLDLNAGAIQLGTLDIPATGGWQSWTTISHTVEISAGSYPLGISAILGGWNINWLKITKI